jgi:hypothetical protein
MTNVKTAKSAYRALMRCIVIPSFVVTITSASSEAQLLYDFVESPSGDVLATLELTSLPATHAEVAGLTFTPAGEAIYGYAGLYSGSFDTSFGMLLDDGIGGLQGNGDGTSEGNVRDSTPPLSQFSMFGPLNFLLVADDNVNEDTIALSLLVGDVGVTIESVGDWRLVPEPSSIGLCLTAILFGAGLGRKSKRYTSRRQRWLIWLS